MTESKNVSPTTSAGGVGFVGLLTVLFVGLKLTGHLSWAWWWVLSPLWASFGAGTAFVAMVLSVGAFVIWRNRGR